jgi:hypothetical protein
MNETMNTVKKITKLTPWWSLTIVPLATYRPQSCGTVGITQAMFHPSHYMDWKQDSEHSMRPKAMTLQASVDSHQPESHPDGQHTEHGPGESEALSGQVPSQKCEHYPEHDENNRAYHDNGDEISE